MKKKAVIIATIGIALIILAIIISIFLFGDVNTKISYTYTIENGENVKLTLNSTGGYSIIDDSPILITKNDGVISKGKFISGSSLEVYEEGLALLDEIVYSTKEEKDNITYFYFNYNNTEFDYIIKIKDSDIGFMLTNYISEESAIDVFERLSFEIVE